MVPCESISRKNYCSESTSIPILLNVPVRITVEPLTGTTCVHAIDIKERHGFSIWGSSSFVPTGLEFS